MVDAWTELRLAMKSPESPEQSLLGLQLIQVSLQMVASTYNNLRLMRHSSVYSVSHGDYVPYIGHFMQQLCFCFISRLAEDIALESISPDQGIWTCSCISLKVDYTIQYNTIQYNTIHAYTIV